MIRKIVNDTKRSDICRVTLRYSMLEGLDINKPIYAVWLYTRSNGQVRVAFTNASNHTKPSSDDLLMLKRKVSISGKTLIASVPSKIALALNIGNAPALHFNSGDHWYTVTVSDVRCYEKPRIGI